MAKGRRDIHGFVELPEDRHEVDSFKIAEEDAGALNHFKVECKACGQKYDQHMTGAEQSALLQLYLQGISMTCPIVMCGACGSKEIVVWRRVR